MRCATPLAALLVLTGCPGAAPPPPRQIDDGTIRLDEQHASDVDLLVVADDSWDMAEELDVLSAQIQVLVDELLRPTSADHPAFASVRIGIATTDLDVDGVAIQECTGNGDSDGLLRVAGREPCPAPAEIDGCADGSCPWVEARPEHAGTNLLRDTVACRLDLPISGCGVEQPLEAAFAALHRAGVPGDHNEGFLREDSLLVVLYVSSEDDCSMADASLQDPTLDIGPMNTRCAMHPEYLHPVQGYVDALRELRPGREDLVVVGVIAGVPVDGSWEVGDSLDDLRALQRPDPEYPDHLEGTCDTSMGGADPPVRLATLAYAFEDAGFLGSICRDDWTTALTDLARTAARRGVEGCLSGRPDDGLFEGCRLVEIFPDDRSCPQASSGWHIDLGTDAEGRRQCEVAHFAETGDGWYHTYSGTSCEHGVIEATRPDILDEDAEVAVYCAEE